MMKIEDFKEEIEDFIGHGIEYFYDVKYKITNSDPDSLFAEITGYDQWRQKWTVPVGVSCYDGDECVISDEPDMYSLPLNTEGFFMYLFVDAANEIFKEGGIK